MYLDWDLWFQSVEFCTNWNPKRWRCILESQYRSLQSSVSKCPIATIICMLTTVFNYWQKTLPPTGNKVNKHVLIHVLESQWITVTIESNQLPMSNPNLELHQGNRRVAACHHVSTAPWGAKKRTMEVTQKSPSSNTSTGYFQNLLSKCHLWFETEHRPPKQELGLFPGLHLLLILFLPKKMEHPKQYPKISKSI